MNPRVLIVPWLGRWLAICLGPVILAVRPLSESELAHELVHYRQWRRYPATFAFRYLWASVQAARCGHWYWDNRFEVEARA